MLQADQLNLRQKRLEADTRTRALAILVLGGVFLGVSPVVVKATSLPPEISAFYRVALAAPLFLAWTAFSHQCTPSLVRNLKRPTFGLFALAALFFAADLATMHYAINTTNVAVATLFTNCAPFFVGLFGLLGLADEPTARFWKALPVALVGTVLLIGVSQFTSSGNLLGDVVALVAGALYAAYLTTVKELRARGAAPARIMAIVTFGSALLLFPLFLLQGMPFPGSLWTWSLLITLVVVGQVAGQGFVTVALRQLPVALSSLVLLIQPVVAALLSWLLLGEALSALQIVGISLVLGSIYMTLSPERQSASR